MEKEELKVVNDLHFEIDGCVCVYVGWGMLCGGPGSA